MNNTDLEQKKECTSIIVVELVVNTDIGTLLQLQLFFLYATLRLLLSIASD